MKYLRIRNMNPKKSNSGKKNRVNSKITLLVCFAPLPGKGDFGLAHKSQWYTRLQNEFTSPNECCLPFAPNRELPGLPM